MLEASFMLKSYGVVGWGGVVGWVAHKILVSAPVPLELILTGFDWVWAGPWGFGDLGRGLTIRTISEYDACIVWLRVLKLGLLPVPPGSDWAGGSFFPFCRFTGVLSQLSVQSAA